MVIAAPTSAYKGVAHGALNWDTQLKADIQAYETTIAALVGTKTAIGYAGTVKDWNAGGGWSTQVTQSGNLVTVTFGFDPGANNLSSSSNNSAVGQLPVNYRPSVSVTAICAIYNGGWNGQTCHLQITSSGAVTVAWSGIATITSGCMVSGAITFAGQSTVVQNFDPSGRYGAAAVVAQLQAVTGGRTVDFRYELLDSTNTRKADLTGVVSGSISHDSSADIKRTASFTIRDGYDQINYLSDRIRPWWRLQMPDGGWVEWPQGVFLLSSPTLTLTPDGSKQRAVDAYDQGVVLSSDAVLDRYSIPAGQLFIDAINTLIAGSTPTTAITPSTLRLPVTWDYEAGTLKLTILNDLLSAMNYRSAWFDEYGTLICQPYILPSTQTAAFTYATDSQSVMVGGIDQGLDLFDIPNRFTLVVSDTDRGSFSATFTNTDPASPTSVPSRGRVITSFQDGQSAADLMTLQALVAKTAYELSQVYETETFTTVGMPFHQNAEVLGLTVTDLNLLGVRVEELSWSLPLTVGGLMSHQVRRVVAVNG